MADGSLETQRNDLDIERLREKIVRPGADRPDGGFQATERGDDDDREPARPREPRAELDAVETGIVRSVKTTSKWFAWSKPSTSAGLVVKVTEKPR